MLMDHIDVSLLKSISDQTVKSSTGTWRKEVDKDAAFTDKNRKMCVENFDWPSPVRFLIMVKYESPCPTKSAVGPNMFAYQQTKNLPFNFKRAQSISVPL